MSLPPLVEPAPELTPRESLRYSRHLVLPGLGTIGQRRLKNARVLVIGAGGLGAPALLYLAAAGVGRLGIVDFDVVEESNLQRQIIHGVSDVGRLKVESARESIAAVDPGIEVVVHPERLTARNSLQAFAGYDLVLDGTDNFATRYLVNDTAALAGLPYVWGSLHRFDGQVSVFWDAAPDGRGVDYRDLHPAPPPAGSVPSCAEGGVLGALCAQIGSAMAVEAIKLITGTGRPLLGRLVVLDAWESTWREIAVRRDPGRKPVAGLIDYEEFCGGPAGGAPDLRGAGDVVSVEELRDRLAARSRGEEDFLLIDVREPEEIEIVGIPGAVPIPKGRIVSGEAMADRPELDPGRRIVLYCKTGARSAEALAVLRRAGFTDSAHVDGGVLAWIARIEPWRPRY